MTDYRISVVIPTYNRASSLASAIESVLTQTEPCFEIIIVDDGSTDGTDELMQALSNPRIRYVKRTDNKGAAFSRNEGIRLAKGDWIAFLDSDDSWFPEKLAQQLAFAKANPDKRVVCTGYELYSVPKQATTAVTLEDHQYPNAALLLGCDLSPGTTMMVHREVFQQIGFFDETLGRLEDWDWLLRYTDQGEVAILPQLLARVNHIPLSRGEGFQSALSQFITRHSLRYERLMHCQRRRVFAELWIQVLGCYVREGNFWKGIYPFIQTLRWDPFSLIHLVHRKFFFKSAL